MRDGARLFTAVYVPKDSSRSYPFLINRTPYSVSRYGVDQFRTQVGPSPDFDKVGYIFVQSQPSGRDINVLPSPSVQSNLIRPRATQ